MDFFWGQIIWVAFDFEINGFMKCDGRTLQISEHQALYSLIGNKYGGNGMTNFMLPNIKTETGSYQICIQGIYPSRN
ncbi:MAG: phage tail protein [Bacteroidaceae bacterium]